MFKKVGLFPTATDPLKFGWIDNNNSYPDLGY